MGITVSASITNRSLYAVKLITGKRGEMQATVGNFSLQQPAFSVT